MKQNQPPLHRNVKLLGWASFLNDVASEMIAPLLPVFLVSLGASKTALGWIEGVADAIASLLKLFTGAWSDRLANRRSLIVTGYAMPALLRPLIGLATSWWHVLFIRSGDRFGKGIRTSARDALIADSTPEPQRGYAFGFHRAMDHLGAALGPVLAFIFLWLLPDSQRLLMLLTIIPGILVTLLIYFGLQEQPRQVSTAEPFRFHIKRLGKHFWWFLLCIGIFSLSASSDLFLLLRFKELGLDDEKYLLLIWCIFHLLKSYGNILIGRLTEFYSPKWLVVGGWLLYALIYCGMAWATTVGQAMVLFMIYASYYALTESPEKTIIARMAPDGMKGQAFGWFHFVTGILLLPASVLFGWVYQTWGALLAFNLAACLALIASFLLMFMNYPPSTEQVETGTLMNKK